MSRTNRNTETKHHLKELVGQTVNVRFTIERTFPTPPYVLMCPCQVLGVSSDYGRARVEVSPVGGEGSGWVNMDRVEVGE